MTSPTSETQSNKIDPFRVLMFLVTVALVGYQCYSIGWMQARNQCAVERAADHEHTMKILNDWIGRGTI